MSVSPFLSAFFERRADLLAASAATGTATRQREEPDADDAQPPSLPEGTLTQSFTREEPDQDHPYRAITLAAGTHTATEAREELDSDRQHSGRLVGTQTFTKSGGESTDDDAAPEASLWQTTAL